VRFALPSAVLLAVALVASSALAAPKARPQQARYNLDILGFNEGEIHRLRGAEVEGILTDPGAELFQFQTANWMLKNQRGGYVPVSEVVGRFPERPAHELIHVYQVDLDGEPPFEMLLVPSPALVDEQHRYAPTILKVSGGGYRAIWNASALPGERYRVMDIRDHNGDGRPELLLAGESGQSGYYQFMLLVGHGRRGFATLPVNHVDSIHYVDLDGDDRVEVVVRERVGRRGPAYQWTYVDHLHRWDGTRFAPAEDHFPYYHDEQTIPTLLGDLLDHYAAARPILDEKVEAIVSVRRQTLSRVRPPKTFHARKVRALGELKRHRLAVAREQLEELVAIYPYDVQVLVGLAEAYIGEAEWELALDAALRALSVEPTQRAAWWWAGVAFSQVYERSSAVASFHCAAVLGGEREDGVAYLRARRGEPGMDATLQGAIDQALRELTER